MYQAYKIDFPSVALSLKIAELIPEGLQWNISEIQQFARREILILYYAHAAVVNHVGVCSFPPSFRRHS